VFIVVLQAAKLARASRSTLILPSGSRRALGGELRLPVGRFDLRSEDGHSALIGATRAAFPIQPRTSGPA
jgi:hypothetical protein